MDADGATAGWVAGGAALHLAGAIVVTRAASVPRNVALDRVDAASGAPAGAWRRYVREWTAFNHVRAATGAAAAVLLILALPT